MLFLKSKYAVLQQETKLISSVDSINRSLPKCNVSISNLIKCTDNRKTNGVCEKVNTLLKGSNYHVDPITGPIFLMQLEIKNDDHLIVI